MIVSQTPNHPSPGSPATTVGSAPNAGRSGQAGVQAAAAGRVEVGSVLNHIYRVRRFLARGGMGEVYEGVNINTDERVAIKVILPHLAEDPNIQALFLNEARTLTGLSHPALVQYRVLAQEPTLGAFYIVTEFIDGTGLHEEIGDITPSEAELRALMRRLADGLRAAHELGAIHRDISPDNILLPGGRLEAARIIDFGIAKNHDTPQTPMAGESFGGKFGFTAPEQLGDFGEAVGPWTDVYSLGLVILAIAAGGHLDMGVTSAEALDRRRKGPDLSPLPPGLRPIVAHMLEPDPKTRMRSMEAVIEALDEASAEPATGPAPPGRASPWLVASVAGAALLGVAGLATALYWARPTPAPAPPVIILTPDPVLDSALRSASCAWMTDRMSRGADGLHIELSGVAGDPAAAAAGIAQALGKSGARVAAVDRLQLRPLPTAACPILTAASKFHASSSETTWLQPQASLFHIQPSPVCANKPLQATPVINLRPPALKPGEDIGLFRVDDAGAVSSVFAGMSEFQAMTKARANGKGRLFEDLGAQGLRISLCEKTTGLRGLLMVQGKPPFDLGLPSGGARSIPIAPADMAAEIEAAGKAQGWRSQMAWYEVDRPRLSAAELGRGQGKSATRVAQHPARPAVTVPPHPMYKPLPRPDRHDTLGTDFK